MTVHAKKRAHKMAETKLFSLNSNSKIIVIPSYSLLISNTNNGFSTFSARYLIMMTSGLIYTCAICCAIPLIVYRLLNTSKIILIN